MSVLKIINSYPKVFNTEDRPYSFEEAIRLIASCKSEGTEIQKSVFLIHDSYTAMCKLFKLGLRKPAVELAEHLLKSSKWFQEYIIASEVCKHLLNHYMVHEDIETANKYSAEMKLYRKMADYEHEVRQICNWIIYNNDHGIVVDIKEVNNNLLNIKNSLKIDSCAYHYFFYKCKVMISEGDDIIKYITMGLDYFENAYFKHDSYIIIFKTMLSQEYIRLKDHASAYSVLDDIINSVSEGGKIWFDCIQSYVELLLEDGEKAKAILMLNNAMDHEVYNGLADIQKSEWDLLKKQVDQMKSNKLNEGSGNPMGIEDDPIGI